MVMLWITAGTVALTFSSSSEHFALCHFLLMGENSLTGVGGDNVVISQSLESLSALIKIFCSTPDVSCLAPFRSDNAVQNAFHLPSFQQPKEGTFCPAHLSLSLLANDIGHPISEQTPCPVSLHFQKCFSLSQCKNVPQMRWPTTNEHSLSIK